MEPLAFDPTTMAPEDLRSEPSLGAIKTVPDLVKSYVSAQKLIGAKRIAIPGDKAADADWDRFYNELGRPETPDKYEMPDVKVDESLKPDEKKLADVKAHFHKMGLTPKQAKGIMEYYMNSMNSQVVGARTAQQQQAEQAISGLKQEWGDKYDTNVEVAKGVIKKFGADSKFLEYLESSGMGNNAQLIKVLHNIGMAVLEDTDRGGSGGNPLNLTPQGQAATEIERLKVDKEFQTALGDPRHAGHKDALNRWMGLFAAAHPGTEAS